MQKNLHLQNNPVKSPSHPQKSLITFCANLPFRILQLSGFFPTSIKSSSNSISPLPTPFYLSLPAIWLITLICITLFPLFLVSLTYTQERDEIPEFVMQGRNTFLMINVFYGVASIFCPILSRLILFLSRKKFATFWQSFCLLVEKFQTDNFDRSIQIKWSRNCWTKFVLHGTLHWINSILQSILYMKQGVLSKFDDGDILKFWNVWIFSLNSVLSCFALHGLIYFVASYELIVTLLLQSLSNLRNDKALRVQELVEVYIALDRNVTEFLDLFAKYLNINIMYLFIYLLYVAYSSYSLIRIKEYVLFGLSVTQMVIGVASLYWLTSCASGVERGSRQFCKRVKFESFEISKKSRAVGGAGLVVRLALNSIDYNFFCMKMFLNA